MLALTKGETVIRVQCPDGCSCDASMIPVGTEGTVGSGLDKGAEYKRTYTFIGPNGKMKAEYNYFVQWNHRGVHKNWWVRAHALSNTDPNFPDIVWVE